MRMLRKKRQRLRPLTETEAYARCHGDRDEDVKIVQMERKRRPRFPTTVSGENVRSMFEARLNEREAEAQAAAAAMAAALEAEGPIVDAAPDATGTPAP